VKVEEVSMTFRGKDNDPTVGPSLKSQELKLLILPKTHEQINAK